jgi:hypothetical protein
MLMKTLIQVVNRKQSWKMTSNNSYARGQGGHFQL